MGCFYIESPAMRLLQQKAGVGRFRTPGDPQQHHPPGGQRIYPGVHPPPARRPPGSPIHPLLTDVLDETFGIMVYQEDVSRAAVALAGFPCVEADGLRKVMSKKDREQLGRLPPRFFDGARAAPDVTRHQNPRPCGP
jgi:hypothetical protein